VTVGDLTEAINGAQTVHELAAEIGVNQSTAREFLQAHELIHFVAHPLATNQVTVSPEEVRRRLGPAGQ
jgi:Zn-dependent peptidase ImmA (M78 family)